MAEEKKSFRFGDVTVDRENFQVTKGGQDLTLTPRAFDVLVVLLKNAGRVVEKQEIFDSVWKDTFVTDNALVKVVKEIRQALGEGSQWIETVPKRGYRFVGEVRNGFSGSPTTDELIPQNGAVEQTFPREGRTATVGPVAVSARRSGRRTNYLLPLAALVVLFAAIVGWTWYGNVGTSEGQVRTIAVLPFRPLSDESRDESLEMGMAETLITRLSGLNELVVRPMTAVRKYTDPMQDSIQAGREVQAEAVLEGNLQRAGDRLRVTVRLVDVATGRPIWSEKFDEDFTDIFKVQDSIAERVTNALSIRLSSQDRDRLAKHPTEDPVIYEEYLRCQLLWHGRRQGWMVQSRECFENILKKDPNFALAHVGAADAYVMASGHHRMQHKEAVAKAKEHIARALELDDSLAQAHNALAEIAYQYDYDWAAAERSFRRALDLNPNLAWVHQAYGWFMMCQGRFEEAAVEMDKAKTLDPSSVTIDVGRGRLYFFSRDYEKARQHFEKLLALEPNDNSLRVSMFTILEQQQRYEEAAEQMFPRSNGGPVPNPAELLRNENKTGGWQAFWRKQYEFIKEGEKKRGPAPTIFYANYHARFGPKDDAFYWLNKRIDEADPGTLQYKIDPLYDGLRDDPRFAQLLARVGLTP